MKRQTSTPISASIRLFTTTAASSLTSRRTLQTLKFTTPLWRALRSHGLTRREADVEVGAGTGRSPEAPRSAVARAATSHTVPPTPRCLTCLSAPARAATTLAAPPGTPTTPKPKALLQGVRASSLLPQPVAFRPSLPPRQSVSLIAQKSRKSWHCRAARSSPTLKELMTVWEKMN